MNIQNTILSNGLASEQMTGLVFGLGLPAGAMATAARDYRDESRAPTVTITHAGVRDI